MDAPPQLVVGQDLAFINNLSWILSLSLILQILLDLSLDPIDALHYLIFNNVEILNGNSSSFPI